MEYAPGDGVLLLMFAEFGHQKRGKVGSRTGRNIDEPWAEFLWARLSIGFQQTHAAVPYPPGKRRRVVNLTSRWDESYSGPPGLPPAPVSSCCSVSGVVNGPIGPAAEAKGQIPGRPGAADLGRVSIEAGRPSFAPFSYASRILFQSCAA